MAAQESTGTTGKIQISHSTYKLLVEAGKEKWLRKRSDAVTAKGELDTLVEPEFTNTSIRFILTCQFRWNLLIFIQEKALSRLGG